VAEEVGHLLVHDTAAVVSSRRRSSTGPIALPKARIEPPLMLAKVAVMVRAWADARKTDAFPTSASVGSRFSRVAACIAIGDDGAVVEEHVDVVLGRQEGADVALQHDGRRDGALDGLNDPRARGVDRLADLAADRLLPLGQTSM
jgi:hypothetical protein